MTCSKLFRKDHDVTILWCWLTVITRFMKYWLMRSRSKVDKIVIRSFSPGTIFNLWTALKGCRRLIRLCKNNFICVCIYGQNMSVECSESVNWNIFKSDMKSWGICGKLLTCIHFFKMPAMSYLLFFPLLENFVFLN